MLYNNQPVEVLSTKSVLGRSISQIKILTSGKIIEVRSEDLQSENASVTPAFLQFKSMAARIQNEIGSQGIIAPYESNVIPLPHQILALEKVMSGSFMRFLIADEVGMGKTIEAGLVLKELKLRGIVKRTLIIVPVSAMTQWQLELKKHFNEKFQVYDSGYIGAMSRMVAGMDADNEINFWTQHNQLIVSTDALKPLTQRQGWSDERIAEYNRTRIESVVKADFDLIIIDECHKVGGREANVGRYQMAEILCNAVPNVLLLSATPHRGKSDHFRRIMGLLNSDAFTGADMPSIAELEPYVVRTEKRQAIDYTGKPLFNKRNTYRIRACYDEVRHAKQKKLYDHVSAYVRNGFGIASAQNNPYYYLAMLVFQRVMSSSTQAVIDCMRNRARRISEENVRRKAPTSLDDVLEEGVIGEQAEYIASETGAAYAGESGDLQGLIAEAQDCLNSEVDIKLETLLNLLDELKKKEDNPDLKFLVFTEFTATQRMLCKELKNRGGFNCSFINGSMDHISRGKALKEFKEKTQIMVSTDAAGESLNMQFAHIVINYDLPWNPMAIEQRIGRVDRIGQPFEVEAYNFMVNNSIDDKIYNVIGHKLSLILDELGIDKTADVLDSTIEVDKVNKLYLTSLLDPSKFQEESDKWLEDIKNKLNEYKSTERVLPVTDSSKITVEKTDSVRYSPIPNWLEKMTCAYFDDNKIPYERTLNGILVKEKNSDPKYYTFDTKESLENPIPEMLTVQSDFIQRILRKAAPITRETPVPVLKINNPEQVCGTFMLWKVSARNAYENQYKIAPVFISNEGDPFVAYAARFWADLSMGEIAGSVVGNAPDGNMIFDAAEKNAEQTLLDVYNEMEQEINSHSRTMKQNKEKAYSFQQRQISRIGIETIRNYRMQKLQKEYDEWLDTFGSMSQVVPELECLMIVKVENG